VRLNCNNLVSNRVATRRRIRKLLISLTNDSPALFAGARQSGKFFDTWSIRRQPGGQVQTTNKEEISRLHTAERVDRGAEVRNDADLHVFVTLVSALLRKGSP
jgi:hypothetical protein